MEIDINNHNGMHDDDDEHGDDVDINQDDEDNN